MAAKIAPGGPPPPEAAKELVDFLNRSWTAFHAVDECRKRLLAAGFEPLSERAEWKLRPGGKYFFTRNYSTIAAFTVGRNFKAGDGFWVIGAHTDSPCLKLKPVTKLAKSGFLSVAVQTYGGGLWHTWFDRDLSLAGRVLLRRREGEGAGGGAEGMEGGATSASGSAGGSASGSAAVAALRLEHRLGRIDRPILRIPTLAIHLDREVNSAGFKVNSQTHTIPVLATAVREELNKPVPAASDEGEAKASDGSGKAKGDKKGEAGEKHHSLLLELLSQELACEPSAIADFELQLCDTQPSAIGGALNEFVFSGRLDNLASSFCALQALLSVSAEPAAEPATGPAESGVRMVLLFDHEECGSGSAQGAESPLLLDAIRRITAAHAAGQAEGCLERAIQKSFVVSADMAHCQHPNYPERHEELHQPRMHKGLVIKHNANQRYATNAVTATLFREIATSHGIPTQDFVVRNDTGCGSTIGPILAAGTGIRTVDVGAPQLSMHSIREMCGTDDVAHTVAHFTAFFKDFATLDAQLVVDDV